MKKHPIQRTNVTTKLRRHTGVAEEPRRAAARLEGVVKNKGIKPKRKEPREPIEEL